MLYEIPRKSCPELIAAVRQPYHMYGLINAPVCLDFRAAVPSDWLIKCGRTEIRTVRILSPAGCLELRAAVPCLGIRATFLLLSLLPPENGNLLSLSNSQSLIQWNEFSFGLFSSLESLGDS